MKKRQVIRVEKLKKSYFSIDICDEYYEGYHNPNFRWNGWAVPYFTKEVADIIKNNMSSDDLEITYDKEKDQYVAIFNNNIEEKEVYEKEIIDMPEGKIEVYPIGAGSWIWDDYSLEDVKKDSDAIIISSETITNEKKEDFLEIDY